MGYMDMLTKFFSRIIKNVDSNNRNIGEKFYLKPHAEKKIFSCKPVVYNGKKPSDLGFSDEKYNLQS